MNIVQFAFHSVCAPYRLDYPAHELRERYGFNVRQTKRFADLTEDASLEATDLVIFQCMPMCEPFRKACENLRERGAWLVYEIDDNLLNLMPGSKFASRVPKNYSSLIR